MRGGTMVVRLDDVRAFKEATMATWHCQMVQLDEGLWTHSTQGRRQRRVRPYLRCRTSGLSSLNEGQTIEYEIVSNRGKESADNLKVR